MLFLIWSYPFKSKLYSFLVFEKKKKMITNIVCLGTDKINFITDKRNKIEWCTYVPLKVCWQCCKLARYMVVHEGGKIGHLPSPGKIK